MPEKSLPTKLDIISHQRNILSQRCLDLEADNAILNLELAEAQARIAELEKKE